MNSPLWIRSVSAAILLAGVALPRSEAADKSPLADQLRALDGRVVAAESDMAKQLPRMLSQHARDGLRAANERETRAWREVKTRADWERYRDVRIQALRDSLGTFPPAPKDVKVRVVKELEGDGYRLKNIVFETRPRLGRDGEPLPACRRSPVCRGILICHSHHNPKTQGELQDMGMTWARPAASCW